MSFSFFVGQFQGSNCQSTQVKPTEIIEIISPLFGLINGRKLITRAPRNSKVLFFKKKKLHKATPTHYLPLTVVFILFFFFF